MNIDMISNYTGDPITVAFGPWGTCYHVLFRRRVAPSFDGSIAFQNQIIFTILTVLT